MRAWSCARASGRGGAGRAGRSSFKISSIRSSPLKPIFQSSSLLSVEGGAEFVYGLP